MSPFFARFRLFDVTSSPSQSRQHRWNCLSAFDTTQEYPPSLFIMTNKPVGNPPMRIQKWSTKPADHNATRVRNNQRRHRARVKSHIQDLEKRLEETNEKLESALSTVASLTAELEAFRRRTPLTAAHDEAVVPSTAPTGSSNIFDHSSERSEGTNIADAADCDCQSLPTPAPGESTVPCNSAFQIIEQQNYSGIEVTTIKAWLGPGFRKALKPGEPCRVESGRVYELLDHITSAT